MPLTPPPREVLLRSPVRRAFWNFWFAWQAQNNVLRAFHPEQAHIPFSWARIFGRMMFTVNDPKLIHQVLVDHHSRYHKGQLFQRLFRPGLGESVLTAEGPSWSFRRRMIAPAFHARALKALEVRMNACIDAAVDGLGSDLDAEPWATRLALNIALDGLFSGGAGDQTAQLAYHMKQGIDGYGQLSTPDVLNFPAWWPRPARRRARHHADQVDALVFALIDRRRDQAQAPDRPDLLDLILATRDEETGEGLDRQDIRNEVFTFFAAGYDTTANALQWTLHELAKRPDLQAQIVQEVAHQSDWRRWTLLSKVIREVLRLYPPVFALLREAVQPDVLQGVQVPVGALIIIPIYHLHRGPQFWDTPEVFNPSHFEEGAVAARPRHAYIPFGSGPRVCPGQAMAQQTLTLTLAALLRRFEIVPDLGKAPEPFAKLTLRPSHSQQLHLKPRA